MATDFRRGRSQGQRRTLEKLEHRELPGNDASWYRALLVDQDEANGQTQPPPQTDTPVPDETPDPVDALAIEGPELLLDIEPADESEDDPADTEPEDAAEPVPVDFPPNDEVDQLSVAALEPDLAESLDPAESLEIQQAQELPTDLEPADLEPAEPESPDPDADKVEPPLIAPVPEQAADDSRVDNTSEMVGQLWTSQEPESPLDDWAPDAMNSKISSTRPFR